MTDFGRVEVREIDPPTITSGHDVIVRVAAAGVCRTDLETIDGGLREAYGTPQFPYVVGHENAGWVEALGTDVKDLAVGDAVLLHPLITCGRCRGCRAGRDMYCSNSEFPGVDARNHGGFAEYIRTAARAVVRVPQEADLVGLSPYSDAGITAYHAVKRLREFLVSGSTVVVIGVGGVGHFGVQLLRRMSAARIVAIEPAPSRAELAKQLGADDVFAGPAAEHVDDVLELTEGGADVVIDFGGSADAPDAALRMLAKGGVYAVVGAGADLTASTLDIAVRELTVLGNLVGTHTELVELVELHGDALRSEHVTYALEDAPSALADLRNGRIDGRAVLVPTR